MRLRHCDALEVVAAELGADGRLELPPQRIVDRPQRRGIHALEVVLANVVGAERVVGHEEADLGRPQPIEPLRQVADLDQVPPQLGVVQRFQAGELLAGEEVRPGDPVVIVDLAVADGHLGGGNHVDHLRQRPRQQGDPPAFALALDGLADLLVADVEELDAVLGNDLLEHFVGLEGQRHVLRIGPDQHVALVEHQVDRGLPFGRLFFARQRRLAGGGPLGGQQIQVGHALHGMDAGQGHDRPAARKDGPDAGSQLSAGVSGQRVIADDSGSHASLSFVRGEECLAGGMKSDRILPCFALGNYPAAVSRTIRVRPRNNRCGPRSPAGRCLAGGPWRRPRKLRTRGPASSGSRPCGRRSDSRSNFAPQHPGPPRHRAPSAPDARCRRTDICSRHPSARFPAVSRLTNASGNSSTRWHIPNRTTGSMHLIPASWQSEWSQGMRKIYRAKDRLRPCR